MEYSGTIEYHGVEFDVIGNYVPFQRGQAYLANGDPGYPDEGMGCCG